ncbi:MAG TPA: hypothetical protein VH087_13155, partial [Thermoanaerobaculia bacterium]|nr:hypothetical protein [Thermoanaerobaculia bacterium]
MKPRAAFLFILICLVAPLLFGVTLTVGVDIASPNASDNPLAVIRTDISLDNPASATGTVTSVKIPWSNSGCTNAIKIKFFHRVGDNLTLTAERGPFNSAASTIAMSPAVPVQQGDLIGVARLADCGNAETLLGIVGAGYLVYSGDVTGTVPVSGGARAGNPMSLYGTGTATEAVAAILPAVGSVTGTFGSSFKTSLQLLNPGPGSSPMTGRLVFHQAGVAGSSTDTSYTYSIPAGQALTLPDLGTAMGTTGLGSLDMIVASGAAKPQIVARIFNDAGTAGTAGFFEDPITPADANFAGGRIVSQGATSFMLAPVDPTRTRLNIGVRTLFSGALLTAQLLDNAGHVLASVTKTYTANYFEQVDATGFFGGVPVGASNIIKISVSDGNAIIYGSTTDNVT